MSERSDIIQCNQDCSIRQIHQVVAVVTRDIHLLLLVVLSRYVIAFRPIPYQFIHLTPKESMRVGEIDVGKDCS